jgi:hypothetical protein
MKGVMLPADQDIARAFIALHGISHTARIISVARDINRESQIVGQWVDCIVWPLSGAVYFLLAAEVLIPPGDD